MNVCERVRKSVREGGEKERERKCVFVCEKRRERREKGKGRERLKKRG
jgi:hypothetical protein